MQINEYLISKQNLSSVNVYGNNAISGDHLFAVCHRNAVPGYGRPGILWPSCHASCFAADVSFVFLPRLVMAALSVSVHSIYVGIDIDKLHYTGWLISAPCDTSKRMMSVESLIPLRWVPGVSTGWPCTSTARCTAVRPSHPTYAQFNQPAVR